MSRIFVIGLGPGKPSQRTPEAQEALAQATDVIGYGPYVDRVDLPAHITRHPSDNRVELDRARHALELAEQGRCVAIVSGGDAGVFGMASALFEAIDHEPDRWSGMNVTVIPGVSAVLAAAARIGAPLGGDFCVMSLSDNLKPWETVCLLPDFGRAGGLRYCALQPSFKGTSPAVGRGFRSAASGIVWNCACGLRKGYWKS